MSVGKNIPRQFLLMAPVLILSLVGACLCELASSEREIKTVLSSQSPTNTPLVKQSVGPLESTISSTTATSTTKKSAKTTKAFEATERPATARLSTTGVYTSTKGAVKNARRQKLNSSSSALGAASHLPVRLQDRLAIDCELPVLPRESRLWRGNETHELNLPVTCAGGSGGATPGGAEEECPPVIVSWEGSADIQSGDILIVRIADSLLLENFGQPDTKNETLAGNATRTDGERTHRTLMQPAVYQVTRQGHEHCDDSDGTLLDITPLDERGAKLFTLYNKDLTEGVNLLIVVSENWRSQCVRLKVTVKPDNCGESQDCSGNGVCFTNVSMEWYECQCCGGYLGPHCEERDACNPSPCLNNGLCVDLTQPSSGANYTCVCPYGITGTKCEKDPCDSAPCLNGGSCMIMAINGSTTYHCACADGWAGGQCELSITGGACASNPCVKGICIEQIDKDEGGDEYRCFCQPGYTGKQCELEYNECVSSPCANGGTCTDRVGGFACSCGRGFTGNTCQLKVDLCSPNPCPAHRYCVDRGNSYSCECPRGFVGDECHLPARSACDNNPCAHGGTCWTDVESFYCSCRPGYTGKLCEEDFILEPVVSGTGGMEGGAGSVREVRRPLGLYHDRLHNVYIAAGTLGAAIAIVGVVACDNNPCAHGGTCWTDVESFYCSCRPGYTGKLCEEDFILEPVVSGTGGMEGGAGSVREVRRPLGLYHDRLHNVYIAAGTLGAAIAIVGVVVTACHCRVNKTYSRLLSRLSRVTEPGPQHHWLQDKRAPPSAPFAPPSASLDTTDMYYTLDFSDSQSSPLIQ